MTTEQAKEILLLYRAGTPDASDPEFSAALELAKRDDELRRWLDVQLVAQEKIRVQFKKISPPEGLWEQILSERPVATLAVSQNFSWRRVAVAMAVVFLVAVGVNLATQAREAFKARRFAAYGERMVQSAQGLYGMNLETDDLRQIRNFLAGRDVPSDFALPPGLEKKAIVGCVAQSWRGHPVAMVCFRASAAGQGSDLWLFVTGSDSFPDAPASGQPQLMSANGLSSASWTTGGQTYLLALRGSEASLKAILGL